MPSIGQLLRGSDNGFFDLFERAGANVVRSAELLDELLSGFPESQILARDILVCEQKGDQLTHEIVRKINQSFVTPIDRTDIIRLSSALDDIVDFTEEVADYLGLYGIEAPMVQSNALAAVLLEATRHIQAAIPLVRDYQNISDHVLAVHRLENEGDQIVRGAIASLFEHGVDPMVVIRWKAIFELLEDAIDASERAAFILEGIVIKNA
jgi:uncharacterized protein